MICPPTPHTFKELPIDQLSKDELQHQPLGAWPLRDGWELHVVKGSAYPRGAYPDQYGLIGPGCF